MGGGAAVIKSESVSEKMVCAHTYACASLCLCDLLRVYNGRAVIDSADGRSKNTSHLLLSLRYISLSHSRPFLLTLPSRLVDTELERHLSSSVLVNENDSKAEIIYFELRTKTLAGRLLSPLQLANVHQLNSKALVGLPRAIQCRAARLTRIIIYAQK